MAALHMYGLFICVKYSMLSVSYRCVFFVDVF